MMLLKMLGMDARAVLMFFGIVPVNKSKLIQVFPWDRNRQTITLTTEMEFGRGSILPRNILGSFSLLEDCLELV